jgi:hypothetical protein
MSTTAKSKRRDIDGKWGTKEGKNALFQSAGQEKVAVLVEVALVASSAIRQMKEGEGLVELSLLCVKTGQR